MAVQDLEQKQARELFFRQEVISSGKGVGRLWGISGGFLDLVAVIIEIRGSRPVAGGVVV